MRWQSSTSDFTELDGPREGLALIGVEVELDHPLDALGADHHRHAGIEPLHVVLAVQIGGAGQHPLLVLEIGFGHLQGSSRRRVKGRAGLQQADDFGPAVARALHDLIETLLRDPSHLDEVGERNAGDGRVAYERHHGVAMAAKHHGGHVLHADIEFLGDEVPEARGIEDTGHAHHLVAR